MQQRKTEPNQAAEMSRYLGIGLTMALSTALFLYLGLLADRRLGTEPWLTVAGTFVGAGAGFYYMYRHLVIEPQRAAGKNGGARHEGRNGPTKGRNGPTRDGDAR